MVYNVLTCDCRGWLAGWRWLQVRDYVAGVEASMAQCRLDASAQAQAVLDSVLAGLAEEVTRVQVRGAVRGPQPHTDDTCYVHSSGVRITRFVATTVGMAM